MFKDILTDIVSRGTISDIFVITGSPVRVKDKGLIVNYNDERLLPDAVNVIIEEIYKMAFDRSMSKLKAEGDDEFSFAIPGTARFRTSIFKQRGSLSAVIRIVKFELPDPTMLGIPENVLSTADINKGMVLVTGPAGSGKSTTLACIIDRINNTRHGHIITLEDPIEFIHRHKSCLVTQREIGLDTESYITGLRAALRQAPDAILLGEMRDYETIRTALTAAETGHMLYSTLHTIGAANSISRIVDIFNEQAQAQIRVQLAAVLQAVISQQLIPGADGTPVLALEVMRVTPAIRNLIRENKLHQIGNAIIAGQNEGMQDMDGSILKLYKSGRISKENALSYASDPERMKGRL